MDFNKYAELGLTVIVKAAHTPRQAKNYWIVKLRDGRQAEFEGEGDTVEIAAARALLSRESELGPIYVLSNTRPYQAFQMLLGRIENCNLEKVYPHLWPDLENWESVKLYAKAYGFTFVERKL